jgi:hypothetical protein
MLASAFRNAVPLAIGSPGTGGFIVELTAALIIGALSHLSEVLQ